MNRANVGANTINLNQSQPQTPQKTPVGPRIVTQNSVSKSDVSFTKSIHNSPLDGTFGLAFVSTW